MLESNIQSKIKKHLESRGWVVKKLSNLPGWPDLLCLKKPGRVLFIEVKQVGKKPRPLQQYVHNLLTSLGFQIIVASSIKDIPDEL